MGLLVVGCRQTRSMSVHHTVLLQSANLSSSEIACGYHLRCYLGGIVDTTPDCYRCAVVLPVS